MKQKFIFLFFLAMHSFFCNAIQIPTIYKKQLSNGLTVLVRPVETRQKVSIQLWYNIGSKDEDLSEKGLAHFIEHMIFKGTERMSESDIPAATQLLSGNVNALTTYDSTRFLFNLPPAYWKEALPIIADCMRNCTFKEDLLNAELKTVIQEMKMYHDNYKRMLQQKLVGAIFPDHPYHYPIIGYKHDLWNLNREQLLNFYHEHYLPNNAALIIVGNVNPDEVFELVQESFGLIESNLNYKKRSTFSTSDLSAQTVTLYRDVKTAYAVLAWVIPGFTKKMHSTISILHSALTGGKMSRLYHLLVDDLQLATSLGSYSWGLYDHDLFMIAFEPKRAEDIPAIVEHVQNELALIAQNGLSSDELARICKQYRTERYDTLEDNYEQATLLGQAYLGLKDEHYPFIDHWKDHDALNLQAKELARNILRPSLMHMGTLLPINASDQEYWAELQKNSDQEDTAILEGKIRETEVEPVKYAANLILSSLDAVDYPQPKTFKLSNGLSVFYYHNASIPKISAAIQLKANHLYDSETLPGLYSILSLMLTEGGTKKRTADEIGALLETNAIGLNFAPGAVALNALKEDFSTALELCAEILSEPNFDAQALEKIRDWALQDYKHFIQNPNAAAAQKVKEVIFAHHPKSKNGIGTPESIAKIMRDDLFAFHQKYISPEDAAIAIVGDLEGVDLRELLEKNFGTWRGPKVDDLPVPALSPIESQLLSEFMQRDQTVLCFAGLSVNRQHQDYEKLLLFDQLFGNGLGSKLFELREKTGAFYTIRGSTLSGSGKYPGMFFITTIVSNDRLAQAEQLIRNAIDNSVDSISNAEIEMAKQKVLISPDDFYSTNDSMANTFLFLNEYELPWDYFTKRTEKINAITLDEVKTAVKKVLRTDAMVTIKVGRVS
ncbi:insulinase family protein [Candidatus Dependentiae bacterium]|nr:insulinase family protein [Candidatus Dependentiae bacterium]